MEEIRLSKERIRFCNPEEKSPEVQKPKKRIYVLHLKITASTVATEKSEKFSTMVALNKLNVETEGSFLIFLIFN